MSDEQFLKWIADNCKVVYFPTDNTYPIEHNRLARKEMWEHLRNVAQTDMRSEISKRELQAKAQAG